MISVVTSGPQPDPDGYLLALNGYQTSFRSLDTVRSNDVLMRDLEYGTYSVALADVASNCSMPRPGYKLLFVRPTDPIAPTATVPVTCFDIPARQGIAVTVVAPGEGWAWFPSLLSVTGEGAGPEFVKYASLPVNQTVVIPAPSGRFRIAFMPPTTCTPIPNVELSAVVAPNATTPLTFQLPPFEPPCLEDF